MQSSDFCTGIILAGGSSVRFGSTVQKQFFWLEGKPLLHYSLAEFQEEEQISDIVVVYFPNKKETTQAMASGFPKVSQLVAGGDTRQKSVFNALQALSKQNVKRVVIHDSARPFFGIVLKNVLAAMTQHDAVIPTLDISDTLYHFQTDASFIVENRKEFLRVQTPQGFDFDLIWKAHQNALQEKLSDFPDDGSLIAKYGGKLLWVAGSPFNMKITTPMDILVAKAFAKYLQEPSVIALKKDLDTTVEKAETSEIAPTALKIL